MRSALRLRFRSPGKTDRVYAIWRAIRAEQPTSLLSLETAALEAQLKEALQRVAHLETALFDAEQRAARSEERERIHQDRWAKEIYELREHLRQLGLGARGLERSGN